MFGISWSVGAIRRVRRVNVFLAGTSFLPDYGGPAFSVSRLATALSEAGATVGIWAPDQSAAITPLLPSTSSVRRLVGTEADALNGFRNIDVLHDNGIWLPHNHRLAALAAKRGIPRVVSTRGMLEPWSVTHKRIKKSVAWWLYQRWDLQQACCHHTTCEAEAGNVQSLGLGVPIVAVPNGVDVPELRPRTSRSDSKEPAPLGRRTALFLSRIHPKKGLPMLIAAWARVRPHGWRLRIVGPDEAGHQKDVETAVAAAGLADVVSFTGSLAGRSKTSAFFDADLFVLPTLSENFGIVVAEALAHGLPVLTTREAPWAILEEGGCGWWVDATVDGLENGLRRATNLDAATLRAMGAQGRAVVRAQFEWKSVAELMLSTYEEVVTNHSANS
jgi:glycosyltransferase involved in cell wall biosynthesis